MVKRLQTPPINLSPSLVETMDIVCVMARAKTKGKEVRRLKQVTEVISVSEEGRAETNIPFKWDPRTDTFYYNLDNSYVIQQLIERHGFTRATLMQEFEFRTRLLYELYRRKIFDYREVQKIISEYMRAPRRVLKQFGIIK